jgi:SAM-dependent methyltransferase/uncharacterized protein YbaR (Trm112 family)
VHPCPDRLREVGAAGGQKDVIVYERLLSFLRCPTCGGRLEVEAFAVEDTQVGPEISEGLLHCAGEHWFPVTGGIPRMLPDSLAAHWPGLEAQVGEDAPPSVQALRARLRQDRAAGPAYDRRTSENFSLEWQHHEVGDKTWGMDLDYRVQEYFLDSIHIPAEELEGKLVLDAGCGNGSQSVAYTTHGLEVVAVDLSSGLERGQRFRHVLEKARPDRVHFVQGDLQSPPLALEQFDIIHSSGVLHHTPDTEATFRRLTPLLRPGGVFYIWLYKHERFVTPLVNTIRAVTTRIPPAAFARVASWSAFAFQVFCRVTNATGIRSYPPLARREAALALMDIFGAPYAHYHSLPEVERWYRDEGFDDIWGCNETRRGFGACGRLAARPPTVA